MSSEHGREGFTLIELSVVLVIIGFIVGGILVGQDLIKAAEVRAQISQIEKYNSAVNTFRAKFGAIPGDMAVSVAKQFGFSLDSGVGGGCTGAQGWRDGNGLIDGAALPNTLAELRGETGLFWMDLSSSVAGNLIDGQFPNTGGTIYCNASSVVSGAAISEYLPTAKIGHGNFIYVYETGGFNWYGLSVVTASNNSTLVSSANIPVIQIYNIDRKADDGLPTTGAVQANYINNNVATVQNASNAATDSTTSCYNTTSNAYSISSLADYGTHGNCALSFRFQ